MTLPHAVLTYTVNVFGSVFRKEWKFNNFFLSLSFFIFLLLFLSSEEVNWKHSMYSKVSKVGTVVHFFISYQKKELPDTTAGNTKANKTPNAPLLHVEVQEEMTHLIPSVKSRDSVYDSYISWRFPVKVFC